METLLCPNCSKHLKHFEKDNQSVLHCTNCGGTFFEQNGINRISVGTARELAADKKTNVILGNEHKCPHDGSVLTTVLNEEAIPQDVTLLRCSACFGVFAYPEDLLKFKRAQHVKIQFFKIWGKPMPSIQSVLVMAFLAIIGLSLALQIVSLRSPQLTTSSADEIIKEVELQKTGNFYVLYFQTTLSYRSSVVITDTSSGQVFTKEASKVPTKIHTVTIPDLSIGQDVTYEIILTDDAGVQIKSGVKHLLLH